MNPLRIYIDTSVLGGCFDVEFAPWSNGLMRDFRAGRLTPVLSDVTAAEVGSAPEPVRDLHQENRQRSIRLSGSEHPFPEGGDHV